MSANKIFFDTYYPHTDKDDAGTVYIVLKDARIYTSVARREIFENGLYRGCFIESRCSVTEQEAKASAMRLINAIGARFVPLEKFTAIESQNEAQRVAKAFTAAESMIMGA